MIRPLVLAAAMLLTPPAYGHDWYTGKVDPQTGRGCCGGSDCNEVPQDLIDSGAVAPSADGGFDVRLTLEDARGFNTVAQAPISTHIPPERVQPAEISKKGGTGYSLCIVGDNIQCFFAPLSY